MAKKSTDAAVSFGAIGRQVWKTPSNFLRASKALRKPLTTSGWTRPELPSGYGREKVTNKLTLLGVFQTCRPIAPKLTAASVDCDLTRE
uniref:Transposase n=1 Tax=Heterorhabditis bacteriophora TaxID=37862 RepID=A0A1I7XNB9_HETBA